MNELGALCKAIASVSIVSGVITALMPKSKLTNAVNTLSAIIVLYTFLMPFTGSNAGFKINTNNFIAEDTSDIENAASDLLIELSEKELKRKIEIILSENKINTTCEIVLTHKENGSFEVKITINGYINENQKEIIKKAIETELERSVYIEYSE